MPSIFSQRLHSDNGIKAKFEKLQYTAEKTSITTNVINTAQELITVASMLLNSTPKGVCSVRPVDSSSGADAFTLAMFFYCPEVIGSLKFFRGKEGEKLAGILVPRSIPKSEFPLAPSLIKIYYDGEDIIPFVLGSPQGFTFQHLEAKVDNGKITERSYSLKSHNVRNYGPTTDSEGNDLAVAFSHVSAESFASLNQDISRAGAAISNLQNEVPTIVRYENLNILKVLFPGQFKLLQHDAVDGELPNPNDSTSLSNATNEIEGDEDSELDIYQAIETTTDGWIVSVEKTDFALNFKSEHSKLGMNITGLRVKTETVEAWNNTAKTATINKLGTLLQTIPPEMSTSTYGNLLLQLWNRYFVSSPLNLDLYTIHNEVILELLSRHSRREGFTCPGASNQKSLRSHIVERQSANNTRISLVLTYLYVTGVNRMGGSLRAEHLEDENLSTIQAEAQAWINKLNFSQLVLKTHHVVFSHGEIKCNPGSNVVLKNLKNFLALTRDLTMRVRSARANSANTANNKQLSLFGAIGGQSDMDSLLDFSAVISDISRETLIQVYHCFSEQAAIGAIIAVSILGAQTPSNAPLPKNLSVSTAAGRFQLDTTIVSADVTEGYNSYSGPQKENLYLMAAELYFATPSLKTTVKLLSQLVRKNKDSQASTRLAKAMMDDSDDDDGNDDRHSFQRPTRSRTPSSFRTPRHNPEPAESVNLDQPRSQAASAPSRAATPLSGSTPHQKPNLFSAIPKPE